jgi:hypothetical protein
MGRRRKDVEVIHIGAQVDIRPAVLAPLTADPGPVYAFPTRSRCPRCGSIDTVARSTQGRTQYRRCRVAICRGAFKVTGVFVK